MDWPNYTPPKPELPASTAYATRQPLPGFAEDSRDPQSGLYVFEDFPIAELIETIDWTPFFQSWEMRGRYPDILNDPTKGPEAKKLFNDAQTMLEKIVEEHWLEARGAVAICPARTADNLDDIEILSDDRREVRAVAHHLRQQAEHRKGVPNRSLSDFVAPADSGKHDWIGCFAVTAGLGASERVEAYKKHHDDYNAIMIEALADRLAESFAEWLHRHVRTQVWGYAAGEQLANTDLIGEKYAGIRPAPGYPACPEHTEKDILWQLLDAEHNTGIQLTESRAMWPGAAVSGWYFSHPDSRYFVVGRVAKDQVRDYAMRKGWDLETAEKWVGPNLGYEPEA